MSLARDLEVCDKTEQSVGDPCTQAKTTLAYAKRLQTARILENADQAAIRTTFV